ncbi:retropepsin-like aspartic protease [Clostridium formicaceticum]|uniref:Aspartyl protease n=1 Tax=Clostridium formicaceticum TaxID=1497 RepID=A0AAC9RN88_9CLOT|nr:retropepsin-like aspartic protease [Clostridium formicaceticum]AOY77721.1 aspartyl protease [Clostridium formicaceticum]ARE88315.1 hypothetical protein CLFO_27160 [Clostridium formicaceticum]
MKIEYRNGLLFTTIEVVYKGQKKKINNIVIDTGASETLLSQECVDDIGIKVAAEDELVVSYGIGGKEHAFSKKVDEVNTGSYRLKHYKLDFTSFQYEDINGLLGLDILISGGYIVDLKDLLLHQKSCSN